LATHTIARTFKKESEGLEKNHFESTAEAKLLATAQNKRQAQTKNNREDRYIFLFIIFYLPVFCLRTPG
jgi:hypothetical protein